MLSHPLQASRLEDELRVADPGCWPVRRNPAALCVALLEAYEAAYEWAYDAAVEQLRVALRQVMAGGARRRVQ